MRILFVHPSCDFSVMDVSRGYRRALTKILGEENIRDYWLNKHSAYHLKALPPVAQRDVAIVAKHATENVLNEALYFNADLVLIVSGLNFHPIALWLLQRVGIPAAAILTESPYDDENQADWAATYPGMIVFTNEQVSAEKHGWSYLRHAFDPAIHAPLPAEDLSYHDQCDVLMVGTGWRERQQLLEQVDWTGIDLRLYGLWPEMETTSPLYPYTWPVCVDNTLMPRYYAGAKICLNLHRSHATARSMNPRAYELAACGAFQISDPRAELVEVFGDAIPTFTNGDELNALIHRALNDPAWRAACVAKARQIVEYETFHQRAQALLHVATQRIWDGRAEKAEDSALAEV